MSMIIEPAKVIKYLEVSMSMHRHLPLFDMHVHPFEVSSGDIDYHPCGVDPQIYGKKDSYFLPPNAHKPVLVCEHKGQSEAPTELQKKVSLMMLKRQYQHTGPGVFKAHMNLCGMGNSLLLPVARPGCDIEGQMRCMTRMFAGDGRFFFGTSVPDSVSNDAIDLFLHDMVRRYNVKAVKLHPNITEIDVSSHSGRYRVEAIVCACQKRQLPLIIHSGKNSILTHLRVARYAVLDNLMDVNWGSAGIPVVIAHAGFYECPFDQIETDLLPKLKRLLDMHSNIFVDISSLDVKTMILIFQHIDTSRILFGSDALYNTPWATIVKTMHALSEARCHLESCFSQIASTNPDTQLFNHASN